MYRMTDYVLVTTRTMLCNLARSNVNVPNKPKNNFPSIKHHEYISMLMQWTETHEQLPFCLERAFHFIAINVEVVAKNIYG